MTRKVVDKSIASNIFRCSKQRNDTCSFICQGTSTRRHRRDFYDLPSQAATCFYLSNYSKVEAIPVSALPKDTTSELAGMISTTSFNVELQVGKL